MLKEKAVSGELLPTDYLWKHGLEDWVRAKSLPGLKFPAPKSPQAPVSVAQPIPLATDEPFAEIGTTSPDANSIFDVMNDQGFVSAPQTPNAALMATTFETGSRSRGRIEFESPPTEWAFLLAAFLVPIPLAFLFAYGYGVLRYYVPFYIVWYVSIFLIGSILSVSTCSLFEKAKFENMIVAVGYLLVLGGIVLYVAWATTITWAINSLPDEFERVYLADILVNPKAVFQIAVEISVHTESTSRRHGTTSSVVYFLLEAVFITVAPVYMTYKRYNESG